MKRTLRSCDAFRAKDDYYYGKINEFRQLNLIDQTNWVMNGQFTENRQIYQLIHSYITENKIVSPSFNYLGAQEGQLLMPDFHNWVQYWIGALYQAKNMVHAKVVKYGELTSKTFNEIRRADYAMFRHMMKCRVGIERGNNNEDNSELTELKQETENTLGDKLAALNDSTITQFSTLEENQNADLGNDNVITGVDNLNIIVNRENYIGNNNNNENNDNTVPPTGSDSARISENNEENDTTHEEIDDAANLHQTIAELRAQLAVAHRRNENLERAAEEDARNPLQLSNNTNDERFEKLFGILNKRNEEEFELRRQQMEIEKLKLIRMAELEEKRQDESKENISKEKEEIKRLKERNDITLQRLKERQIEKSKSKFSGEGSNSLIDALNFRIQLKNHEEYLTTKGWLDEELLFKHLLDNCITGHAKNYLSTHKSTYGTYKSIFKWLNNEYKLISLFRYIKKEIEE